MNHTNLGAADVSLHYLRDYHIDRPCIDAFATVPRHVINRCHWRQMARKWLQRRGLDAGVAKLSTYAVAYSYYC